MAPNRRQLLAGIGAGATLSLVGPPSVTATDTERVFVHPSTNSILDIVDAIAGVTGTTRFEYDNFEFVAAMIPSGAREELRDDARVAFIERDGEMGVPSNWTPSIPDLFGSGGDVDCATHPSQRPSWGWERINAAAADQAGTGVSVGILDTGIESGHCSLEVAGGRNFTHSGLPTNYEDNHGHGTHVAGIAGALDNDIGVVGVAPNSDLYAVKVLDDNGSGRYSNLVAGIDWCMSNDIELISMSLGGDEASSTVDQAIEDAHAAGHLLCSAAGNHGNEGNGSCDEETMTYPATHEDVIAVAAMNEDETLAPFSSVGTAVDLLAPGVDITSTYVDNQYAQASGTSIACPFVTGVAALHWENRAGPGPGPNDDVREVLFETAEPVLRTCEEGHGLVDARAAVVGGRDTAGDGDDTSETGDGTKTDDEYSTDPDAEEHPNGGLHEEGQPMSLLDRLAAVVRAIREWLRGLVG